MDILNIGGLATKIKESHRGRGGWNTLCERAIACRDDQPDMESSVQHSNMTKESKGPKGFAMSNSLVAWMYVNESPLPCRGGGNENYDEGISTLPVDGKASRLPRVEEGA